MLKDMTGRTKVCRLDLFQLIAAVARLQFQLCSSVTASYCSEILLKSLLFCLVWLCNGAFELCSYPSRSIVPFHAHFIFSCTCISEIWTWMRTSWHRMVGIHRPFSLTMMNTPLYQIGGQMGAFGADGSSEHKIQIPRSTARKQLKVHVDSSPDIRVRFLELGQ